MRTTTIYAPAKTWSADRGAFAARWASSPRTAACILLFAVLQQSLGHHNADNSWLFTVCEKWLDGARVYRDIIETNPPASFLLYLPAVFTARRLHLPAEFVVSAAVFAGALGSIMFSRRIARECGLIRPGGGWLAVNAALFALALVPGFSFAEREHIASILILPALAVFAARADARPVPGFPAAAAGLLAGLTMAVKPHFALALLFPILFTAWRQRSPRPVFSIENFTAAAVVLAYGAAVVFLFPDFFGALPSILEVYVPVKEPLRLLLIHPWFLVHMAMLAVIFALNRRAGGDARVTVLAMASLGFAGAFVLQGKGWVNHGLPGVSLAFLALALLTGPALAAGREHPAWPAMRPALMFCMAPALFGLPILFGTVVQFTMKEEYPGLTGAVRRIGPPHPKIMAVTAELDVGHPIVRRVGGVWAGQPHSLWLMLSAQMLIDAKRGDAAKLAAFVDQDARMFADNVRERQPDIILVSRDETGERMMKNPDIAMAMNHYELAGIADEIGIWTPKEK